MFVVVSHGKRICSESDGVEIEHRLSLHNLSITALTPVFAPSVFDNPSDCSVLTGFPSNNFNDVVSLELESIGSLVVCTIRVCQKVSVRSHLT